MRFCIFTKLFYIIHFYFKGIEEAVVYLLKTKIR